MKSEEHVSGQSGAAAVGAAPPRPHAPPHAPRTPPNTSHTLSDSAHAPDTSAPPARVEASAPESASSKPSHAPPRHPEAHPQARREPMAHERRVLLMALAAGAPLMRLSKQPAFFEGRFRIEKLAEMSPQDETRAVLGFLMMVLLERRRG